MQILPVTRLIFILFLSLGGLLWREAVAASGFQQGPDVVMYDVMAIRMDQEGKPESTLHASKMMHYAKRHRIVMIFPHMVFHTDQGDPWEIQAKFGRTTTKVNKVKLWKDVKINQPATNGHGDSILLTEELMIYPKLKLARTQNIVTMLQSGITVKATGLNANMQIGHLELLSKANGEYTAKP